MMGPVQSDELAEIDLTEEEIDAMAAAGEPVEVTGPAGGPRAVHFELLSDAQGAHRWRLVTEDGEILAASAVTYGSRSAVQRALVLLAPTLSHAAIVDMDTSSEPTATHHHTTTDQRT